MKKLVSLIIIIILLLSVVTACFSGTVTIEGRVTAVQSSGFGGYERSTIYFSDGASLYIKGSIDLDIGTWYIITAKRAGTESYRITSVKER